MLEYLTLLLCIILILHFLVYGVIIRRYYGIGKGVIVYTSVYMLISLILSCSIFVIILEK